ncbi:MAG: hypothetical protein RLZZ457_1378 [Pseudomonadota bacterium]
MKFTGLFKCAWLLTSLLVFTFAHAQTAQGEDPVNLTEKVTHNMLPFNSAAQTVSQSFQEVPAWLDAKIARFTAKAFSVDTAGILTDESVATTVISNGLRKVCTQDIGSNVATQTAAAGARLGIAAPLAVVLRGDLINICR